MQSPDADLGQSSLVTTSQDPSTCLPPRTEPLAEKEVSKQPYLAMGSLQWSQRLSPPFPFALRRWSPGPRHLLSLQPGKSRLGFRLPSSSAHKTRPPGGGHGAHPLPELPFQARPLAFWGPADPTPAPWEWGVLEGQRCPRGTGGPRVAGWGFPLRFPSLSALPPSSAYTRGTRGPPAPSAPLRSVPGECPRSPAQPEGGLRRRRRHVPKETAGSQ